MGQRYPEAINEKFYSIIKYVLWIINFQIFPWKRLLILAWKRVGHEHEVKRLSVSDFVSCPHEH